jgi:hypothetical protein
MRILIFGLLIGTKGRTVDFHTGVIELRISVADDPVRLADIPSAIRTRQSDSPGASSRFPVWLLA